MGKYPKLSERRACRILGVPRSTLRYREVPQADETPLRHAELEVQRRPFAQLREIMRRLNAQGLQLDTLSMGMSHDMVAAILEGATIVRVGSAIFGARAKQQPLQ